jgi:hypothetical protein
VERFLYWVPISFLAYALWGLLISERKDPVWGLPRTLWYAMGGITALLVLVLNVLERLDAKRKRKR